MNREHFFGRGKRRAPWESDQRRKAPFKDVLFSSIGLLRPVVRDRPQPILAASGADLATRVMTASVSQLSPPRTPRGIIPSDARSSNSTRTRGDGAAQQELQWTARKVLRDSSFWQYVEFSIFKRLRGDDRKAVLGEVRERLEKDKTLRVTYTWEPIQDILTRIKPPTSDGVLPVLVTLSEFKTLLCKSYRGDPPITIDARPDPSDVEPGVADRLAQLTLDETERRTSAIVEYHEKQLDIDTDLVELGGAGLPPEGTPRRSKLVTRDSEQEPLVRPMNRYFDLKLHERGYERTVRKPLTEEQRKELMRKVEEKRLAEKLRKLIGPISASKKQEVQRLWSQGRPLDIVAVKFNVDLKRHDIQSLRPTQWLNDEVINFFFSLMLEKDKAKRAEDRNYKPCHFFNSFFMSKVAEEGRGYNHASVRRWAKNFDIFTYDKIFAPVNINNMHWCLAVIHMQDKVIQYYDSLGGRGDAWLNALWKYVQDEHKLRKGTDLDMTEWRREISLSDVPRQQNGCDCGAFTTCFAYLLSEGLPVTMMSQDDIPDFRYRMVLSAVKGTLDIEDS